MKSNPTPVTKRAVLAALVACSGILAASAYAASADVSRDKPRCTAKHAHLAKADWAEKRTQHLAALKEKLQLAPGQEAAWNAFAESARPGMRHGGADREAMREAFATLSTPERLDRMQAMAEARHARMAERAEAVKAFYAQLTPAQQRVFDAEAMPQGEHGKPHRQHRHQHS